MDENDEGPSTSRDFFRGSCRYYDTEDIGENTGENRIGGYRGTSDNFLDGTSDKEDKEDKKDKEKETSDPSFGEVDTNNGDDDEKSSLMDDIIDITDNVQADSVVDSSAWIDNILRSLSEMNKYKKSEYKDLRDKLFFLLKRSIDLEVKTYLLKHNFLPLMQHVLKNCDNLELIDILLDILINTSYTFEAINFISKDRNIVEKVLNRLRTNDTNILIQLILFLQLILWEIEQNPHSAWIAHLRQCKYFGDCITSILNNSIDDQLLIETVSLLHSICEINASRNILLQLFQMNKLVSALLNSFMKLIPVERHTYSSEEFSFIADWLTIFCNLQINLFIFEHGNDEILSDLLEIMYRILMPYKYIANLYPMQDLQRKVIGKSAYIISSLHHYEISIPTKINHILATVTFSLGKGRIDEELDPDNLVPRLVNYLHEYWLRLIKICPEIHVLELLHQCKPTVRNYLVDLLALDPSMIYEKLREIH